MPRIVPASMWHECLSRVNAFTDESVSRHPSWQLSTRWCVSYRRTLRCNRKPENSSTPRKTRWFKPSMSPRQSSTNLPEQPEQRAHSKYQVVGEQHTKINLNFNDILTDWNTTLIILLEMWTFWTSSSLNSTGVLDVIQTRSYFPEPRPSYGDPEYVSGVSLVIHCLQLGYRMIRPGCSTVWLNPQFIGFNIRSNASDFG